MDNIEDINKIFEKYLENGEIIEYTTQNTVFPKDNVISFIIFLIFACCFLGFMIISGAGILEVQIAFVFLAVFLYIFYVTIKKPYLFFTPVYYCITNKRLMKYFSSPIFGGIFNQCSLDMVYHVNRTNFHDITFTNRHHLIVFEFRDIPDAKELHEILKGKLQK